VRDSVLLVLLVLLLFGVPSSLIMMMSPAPDRRSGHAGKDGIQTHYQQANNAKGML